ncbi:MAG: periplasmic heavy metal sensor [Desulfobacterales bacterium]
MKNLSKLIPIVAAMAFLLIALSAPVSAGRGVNAGRQGWRPWCAGNLSDEDQAVLSKERQAFFDDTQDLRQDIYQKRLELQSELAKKNPDDQKAAALQDDISKLTEEFDQKRLDFILKMKKTNPDIGRIGGWRAEDDDVAVCPNYGHHMGGWKGYGMGLGMRGPGYGMGPGMLREEDGDWNCPYDGRSMSPGRGYGMMGRGYGMGPGRMGRGYGMGFGYGRGQGTMRRATAQGEFGPTSGRLETPLKEDGARTVVENYLQSTRNPNLKLGKIAEQGDAFEAEIVTKEGSLVDKLLIEKSTGWMHPNNQ